MSLFGGRKRDGESAETTNSATRQSAAANAAGDHSRSSRTTNERNQASLHSGGQDVANIGKSIVFKGELSGDEDLELEGHVEGQINLPNHQVTIGAHARIHAEVNAKAVVVVGRVVGNVNATERIEIQASGVVEGDLRAPRLQVLEGAVVNGAIEMTAKSIAQPSPGSSANAPDASARKAG